MQCDLDDKSESKKGGIRCVERLWPIRLLPFTHVSHTRSQQHTILSPSLRNSATIPHLKTRLIPLQSDLDRIPVARDDITACVSSVQRVIGTGRHQETGGQGDRCPRRAVIGAVDQIDVYSAVAVGFGDGQAADVVAAGVVEEDGDGLLAEGEDGGGAVSGGQVLESARRFWGRRV